MCSSFPARESFSFYLAGGSLVNFPPVETTHCSNVPKPPPSLFTGSPVLPQTTWINCKISKSSSDIVWSLYPLPSISARITSRTSPCRPARLLLLLITSPRIIASFPTPITGVSPGQVLAVYQGDTCLGSAVIHSTRTAGDPPTA